MVPLPESYSEILLAALGITEPKVPMDVRTVRPNGHTILGEMLKERKWFENVKTLLVKDQLEDGDFISRPTYHASMQLPVTHPITINALLPMFYESVYTIAMTKHGMNVIQWATEHLNPGLIPV